MTSTTCHRLVQALVLAAVVAALAAPAAALAGSTSKPAPDWFERYAAAHPQGWGTALGAVTVLDGRSPDTQEAAYDAHLGLRVPVDGRSPDTLDAALSPEPVIWTPSGRFNWRDAGIGAGFASGLLTLIAASGLWFLGLRSSNRLQTT